MPTIISTRAEAGAQRWGAVSRRAGFLALVVLAFGLIALFLWNRALGAVQGFPQKGVPLVVGDNRANYPADFADAARKAIAAAPLDQGRLNALYVFASRAGGDAMQAQRLLALLKATGWRDTAAQRNLLSAAVTSGDLAETASRADGLLRRQRMDSEMFATLHAVEADAKGRSILLRHLAPAPIWRTDFFGASGELDDREALEARVALITAMLARRMPLESREIGPVVNRLIALDQIDQAYALWLRRSGLPVGTTGLTDTDFRQAAERAERGDSGTLPFEWRFEQGQDFAAVAERSAGGADVRFSWNGTGAPIFMRQRFKVRPGQYVLKIAGLDAKPELLRNLVIMAECPGVMVTFDQPDNAKPGGLSLAGDGPLPCAYPELRITAQLRRSGTGFDLSLSSITLVPVERKAL